MNIETFYWGLPYELRRFLFRSFAPRKYSLLQKLRTEEPQVLNSPTFRPFIKKRCIFVHIPKTAGISVGYSLFGRHTGNHTTIQEYMIAFSRKEFHDYFKFAFVRNPWDRLLSAFLFLKKGGRNEGDRQWAEKHLSSYESFDHFVKGWVNTNNILTGIHFIPQYKFLTTPKDLKPQVDFIGLFENIAEDHKYICKTLHIDTQLEAKNKTEGKTRDYRSYYSDETLEIVSNVYRRDIELLGYNFDNTSLEAQISKRSENMLNLS